MKKIISAITAILLVFGLASCNRSTKDGDTAFSLYSSALSTIEKGFEGKSTSTVTISDGQKSETTSTASITKCVGDNVSTANSEGISMVYVDGVLYTNNGMYGKYKETMSKETYEATYGKTAFPALSEELFKGVKIKSDDDQKTFSLTAPNENFKELLTGINTEGMTLSDVTMTATFTNNDVLTKLSYSLTMKRMYQEKEYTIDMIIEMEFIDLGAIPTISVPENADSYIPKN